MPRRIVDIQGLLEEYPFFKTKHRVYKAVRRVEHRLPHRKNGRHLLFDLDQVGKWFDALPGSGGEELNFD